jgi:hypothetical protein
MHPGRWPYLILNEADVKLSANALRKAGVVAVVMMAGELGASLPGERATVAHLTKEGFRAKLIVMPRAGHYYSANIDELMEEAIDFLVASPLEDAHQGASSPFTASAAAGLVPPSSS